MDQKTRLILTGSQTVGPFFKYGLAWPKGEHAFPESAPGRAVTLTGKVIEGSGKAIEDALIEFWQADAGGQFGAATPGSCAGFARVATDAEGRFTLHTRLPGAIAGAAPHILVCLFSRGLLKNLFTHVYFEGEAANANDPVLKLAGARAATLVAKQKAGSADAFEWDLVLQGKNETVFLDV
jgi:protocatechuate 3,4-dioxygenase alpha subunit